MVRLGPCDWAEAQAVASRRATESPPEMVRAGCGLFTSVDGKIGELVGGNLDDFPVFPEDHGDAVLAVLLNGPAIGPFQRFLDGCAVAKNLIDILLFRRFRIHFHSLFTLFHKSSSKTIAA